jgi:protein-S-isoprenylcysteine O-methyltransferase Ste14
MNLVELALAWLGFGIFHSLAASPQAKEWFAQRWPIAAPWYRAGYNGASLLAVLPILYLTYAFDAAPLWQWHGAWRWLSHGLVLVALIGFVVTARWYDMETFLGLRQIRERDRHPDGHERFRISPLHRFVRHPWYFFGLVLVWAGDKTLPLLVSTLAITIYLIVGSKFEERKLLALHGEAYRRYMERVPGLVPVPWKRLSVEEARQLES